MNTATNNVYTASEAMRLTCAYTKTLAVIKKIKNEYTI